MVDPDCLVCADCGEPIGDDPVHVTPAVVHRVCPRDRITAPGVHDIDAELYHLDPVEGGSLSSSGARKLLPPHCPARFRWERDNPPEHRSHWDISHAAHKLVLGTGPELVEVHAENWRTNAAKAARDEAYEAGAVPLLSADFVMVHDMADALRAHPVASVLFEPGRGAAEQSLFWIDQTTGVCCRARLDWLPRPLPGQRLIIPDYKTCHSADPETLGRSMHQFGYEQQDAWYQAGCAALGLADSSTAFVFVCQEKTPPYLVTIVELDHVARRIGQIKNRLALDIYARCRKADEWPAYADEVVPISLPPWVEKQWGDAL